jgi:hypothetical protein
MRPLDTSALTRPTFTDEDFNPTKFCSAADKATFGNTLCRFIATDFKLALFTQKFYQRLSNCFGMIAHYNRDGFFSEYFRGNDGKIAFLDQLQRWPCCGDPAYTFSDVERAIKARLRTCDLLSGYRELRAAEINAAERATLARLRAKYDSEPGQAPIVAAQVISTPFVIPILAPAAPPKRSPRRSEPGQPSLL